MLKCITVKPIPVDSCRKEYRGLSSMIAVFRIQMRFRVRYFPRSITLDRVTQIYRQRISHFDIRLFAPQKGNSSKYPEAWCTSDRDDWPCKPAKKWRMECGETPRPRIRGDRDLRGLKIYGALSQSFIDSCLRPPNSITVFACRFIISSE